MDNEPKLSAGKLQDRTEKNKTERNGKYAGETGRTSHRDI